jgi:hypothetical protein
MMFGFTVARQLGTKAWRSRSPINSHPRGRDMATQEPKTVAFVLYPGLTLLDLVGPLQVFASLRRFSDQYRPVVVAERLEPMATDSPLTVRPIRPSVTCPTRRS